MKAVVFDTGEHGVGGRAATRTTNDASIHKTWLAANTSTNANALRSAGMVFDHAAQLITATDPAFQQQCEEWVAGGAVQRWDAGSVGTLKPGGVFEPLDAGTAVYVATGGMRQLAEHMAEQVGLSYVDELLDMLCAECVGNSSRMFRQLTLMMTTTGWTAACSERK